MRFVRPLRWWLATAGYAALMMSGGWFGFHVALADQHTQMAIACPEFGWDKFCHINWGDVWCMTLLAAGTTPLIMRMLTWTAIGAYRRLHGNPEPVLTLGAVYKTAGFVAGTWILAGLASAL